jgi:hypothetical protein
VAVSIQAVSPPFIGAALGSGATGGCKAAKRLRKRSDMRGMLQRAGFVETDCADAIINLSIAIFSTNIVYFIVTVSLNILSFGSKDAGARDFMEARGLQARNCSF